MYIKEKFEVTTRGNTVDNLRNAKTIQAVKKGKRFHDLAPNETHLCWPDVKQASPSVIHSLFTCRAAKIPLKTLSVTKCPVKNSLQLLSVSHKEKCHT